MESKMVRNMPKNIPNTNKISYKKLVFLIPALNEEYAIAKTITSIRKIPIKISYEIVIVDGGSKDKTVELAKKNNARVISSPKGYGRQYQYAFKRIKCEYIITGDADCTYPFDQAYKYLQEYIIKKDYDFVTTNRFAGLKKESMKVLNGFGNRVLTFTSNVLFGQNIKDSQSGMWIFKQSILKKVHLTSNDMPLSEELKIEAFRKLDRCIELPISYYKRVGESKLNYAHGFKNLIFLFKKRLRG